jgi:hypothetical protein
MDSVGFLELDLKLRIGLIHKLREFDKGLGYLLGVELRRQGIEIGDSITIDDMEEPVGKSEVMNLIPS